MGSDGAEAAGAAGAAAAGPVDPELDPAVEPAPPGALASGLAAPDAGAGCGVLAVLQATSSTPTAMDHSPGRHRVRPCLVRIAVPLPRASHSRAGLALCYS